MPCPFLPILVAHINTNGNGKINDELICREIAIYINSHPFSESFNLIHEVLFDFIYEYGEDEDCQYLGRDEHGEKQYHSHNPDTNWHERIRKELVALGYYFRWVNICEEKELELLQVS